MTVCILTDWGVEAARLVHRAIAKRVDATGGCSVALSGGRAGKTLYEAWAARPELVPPAGVAFFLADERQVPADDLESNARLVRETLFRSGIPSGCTFISIDGGESDGDLAALRYEDSLPARLDVLVLGVGEDGHIASLFPGDPALREQTRRVLAVEGPKPPARRLTLTPVMIREARTVFVMAPGPAKAEVLARARRNPDNINALPASLVLDGTWLLDSPPPGA